MFYPTLPPDFAEAFTVASTDGLEIAAYRVLNRTEGAPALIFGHANGFNAGCYRPFLERLSAHFQVFAFDARGHGASPSPQDNMAQDYALIRFAEDLSALVAQVRDMIGPGVPLHYASHSLGGLAVILLEADLGQAPFECLTLFEPPIYPPKGHHERAAAEAHSPIFVAWAARRRNRFPDRAAFRGEVETITTYRRFADEMMAAYLDAAVEPDPDGGLVLRCPGAVESVIYGQTPESGLFEISAKVATRTRIYATDQDALPELHSWTPDTMAAIAENMINGEARTMPGCLHLMVQEDPAACAAAVVDHALGG